MSAESSPNYFLMLDGRRVGPYDVKTIVGMRIKKTLASDQVLVDPQGTRLTVGELVARHRTRKFEPQQSGSMSLVLAAFTGRLVVHKADGVAIPAFRGPMEVRVQLDGLRLAGRFRQGLRWKEDRVKIPMAAVQHARNVGPRVDLWLKPEGADQTALRRLSVLLESTDEALDMLDKLTSATPPPPSLHEPVTHSPLSGHLVWLAVIGVAVVLLMVGLVLAYRKVI